MCGTSFFTMMRDCFGSERRNEDSEEGRIAVRFFSFILRARDFTSGVITFVCLRRHEKRSYQ